jgi:hypothetical protein
MTGEDFGKFGLFAFGDRRSIQLSYARDCLNYARFKESDKQIRFSIDNRRQIS